MEILKTKNPLEFLAFAESCLDKTNGHEGLVIHICAEPCVWTGQLPTLDEAECKRRGLTVCRGRYLAGSIVNMPGDLSLCLTTWGDSEQAPQWVDKLAAYLDRRGIAITRDENDVLADGKKVISWARATTAEGWQQSVVHCSVGMMDLELVKAVCKKPMVKVPGSLAEYGITAEELLRELRL